MTSHPFVNAGMALAFTVATGLTTAQSAAVKVEGAWARSTVQGQKGTGAFMNITAKAGTRLVGVFIKAPVPFWPCTVARAHAPSTLTAALCAVTNPQATVKAIVKPVFTSKCNVMFRFWIFG